MKKLVTLIMASLLLALLSCSAPEQTGLVLGPPPPSSGNDNPTGGDGGDDGDDPGTDPGEETPPDTPPDTPPATVTDLGATETANSYIVVAPGSYKYKAVKGNGSASVGSVASAALLWETAEGMVTSLSCADGYIAFSTPSTLIPGNALIAAKDASGKILWSWHIWIPRTEVGGNKYGLSFYTTMDRNLGALEVASATSGADSYGLLYQWGRKDPFQCKNATTKSGTMSVDESVANPTTFAANSGTWMSSVDKTIWGDGGSKTIYDPCPPGYKVPMREDLSGFFPMSPLSSAEGWQYAAGHAFAVGNPQVWFPYAGYLDVTGTYTGAGSSAKIWNSHMDSANNQGYGIFLSESTSANSSQKAAQAGSVRCISLEQEAFVNEPGMPVQGGYTRKVFDSGVVELSGLCLSTDGSFLWGVGDGGYLYKFTNIDGSVESITYSQPLSHDTFYGGQYWSESSQAYKDYWYDMEGITLDPNTGDLYIAYEPKRVMRIKSPYTTLEKKLFDVADAAGMDNGGMEGITWYKGDLYVGAQSGATLWKYTTGGSMIWKKQLGTIAPGIEEVGDLFYDSQTDLLWVIDSEAHKIFVFDGEVTKLKAVYPVKDIGNAESICVDHKRSCVWVGDDGSSSKIYKFSFSGL